MRPLILAPLPKWSDLFAAIFNSSAPDDVLAEPWCRPGESAFWFSRSSYSLAVVARWRQQLLGKTELTVWIPAFFCNASLAPLRAMGVKLVFYPVTEQMTPDIAACQELSGQQPLDLFVLVHYFGRSSAGESSAKFCEKHGAWLIEDAAHVLRPIPGVGEIGDCLLYSPHKHLPIPDGAVLVVRPNGPARLAENSLAMNVLRAVKASMFATSGSSMRPAVFWLLKRLAQCVGLRARRPAALFKPTVVPNIAVLAYPRMSFMARRLLTPLLSQLQQVAEQRERNALTWSNILMCVNTALNTIPDGMSATPYLVGFSPCKVGDAEALFDSLHQAGLPVTTWPDLPPEVLADAEAHPVATALRENRIYLPVHQTLSQRQLLACGKSLLDRVTRDWQARALTHDEWESHWLRCHQTNLMQSWQYGQAKEQAEGWKAQRFLIADQNERPIALAQVLTRVLPFMGGVARLNRGPLMFADYPAESEVRLKLAVMRVLLREARRQRWWLLQAAPELHECELARYGLQVLGLEFQKIDPWASGLLDLNLSEVDLYSRLNRRWKRALRKASDCGVVVENEKFTTSRLTDVINSYKILQTTNEFRGITESLIEQLFMQQTNGWTINLFVAKVQNEGGLLEDIGYRLCIHHGDTALDFLVTTNERGRQTEANSALYWHSILDAKQNGCKWFDIGGLGESTPKGIADFKQGLNAKPYKLIGEWRKWY